MQSIVVHTHFYQPPREDPWLDIVEREHSAAPFHDWNTRIEQECYRAVVAARVHASDGRICRIVNLLERLSFNVGSGLLDWLERHAPDTYRAVLRADAEGLRRTGRGNALAMPYHHVILPLASRRDKVTEVRWGIRDFRRRFGRDPEGMWLPETAVDLETLDVLAAEQIGFTVLAPHQVTPVPLHGLPGVVRTSGRRRIAVFPYDGPLAHDVAFGPLIRDGEAWARRMVLPPDDVRGPKLVSLATDGETFGHHHTFGEMSLAAMLDPVGDQGIRIENFASFLARNPPIDVVELVEDTSWSCSHGIGRWRSDCSCRIKPGTSQAWRAPLRDALDWLAGELGARFEREGKQWFPDPWAARDAWDPDTQPADQEPPAAELLEQQRAALRMFTSCGWFFDDIAGVESVLVLRWAARAIDLCPPSEADVLRRGLMERLARARSNDPEAGSGADVFTRRARPRHGGAERAAAGVASIAAQDPGAVPDRLGVYEVVRAAPDGVGLRHARTGRPLAFRAEMSGDGVARRSVALTDPEGGTVRLGFGDLPEPARETLRDRAQQRLMVSAFTAAERELISAGTRPFREVLVQAMLRQLGHRAEVSDLDALRASLDLLALDARPVPFDVQTRFYRLYNQASPEGRGHLRPLAPLFGFSRECTYEDP